MIASQARIYPSIVDQLAEQVFHGILSGDYPVGSKITEEQIATDFGASRTPVREAIRALADLGLIIVRPRCGLEITSVDENDVQQITALRVELETLAVRCAISRLSKENIEELEAIQRRCEAFLGKGARIEVFREDSRFHLALARFSGNSYLYDALCRLDAKVQLSRMMRCQSNEKIKKSIGFHRKILRAIRKGDGRTAEDLLREHIEKTQI